MNIQKITALYFSATGTTAKVALALGEALSKSLQRPFDAISFNLPQVREIPQSFGSDDLVIVATPVYAGRVPNLLLPYLQNQVKGNQTLAIPVCLYGNRNVDDGLMELRNLLQENGFATIGGASIVGTHAFSQSLGKGRPNQADLRMVEDLSAAVAEKIRGLDSPPTQPVEVVGENPIRPHYTPRDRQGTPINILKVKPVTDKEKCKQCRLCARLCPLGAISLEDCSQVPGKCMKCCSCVKRCAVGAKYFDDEGFLYHKRELEIQYDRPGESQIFY